VKKIYIGADHGGFNTKEDIIPLLTELGYEVVDVGTYDEESVDYPDYAKKVADQVVSDRALGILICGTGVGMAIAANKVKGVRAANISDVFSAKMLRAHNNGNILCLGARTVGPELHKEIIRAFLGTEFEGSRHERRVNKIVALEN
jgi:ribose 5-phosphate isomerase B